MSAEMVLVVVSSRSPVMESLTGLITWTPFDATSSIPTAYYLIEQCKSRCGTASAPEPHPCCILHAAHDGHVNRSTRPRAATRRSLLQMFVKKIPTYVLGDHTPITVNASAPETIHVKRSRVAWKSGSGARTVQTSCKGSSGSRAARLAASPPWPLQKILLFHRTNVA